MIEYKGYRGVVEYDEELEFFAGHVVDLHDTIYFEGSSVEELKKSMHRAVDTYLKMCEEDNREPAKQYSGKFVLRMEGALHRNMAVAAALRGQSLNEWAVRTLEENVAS